MKHVALLKSRFHSQGGLEKYALRIVDSFLKKGAHVSILTTQNSLLPPLPAVSVIPTKTAPWPGFLRMEQFDRFAVDWVQKNQPDLIFGMDRNRHQTHLRAGNGSHAAYLKSRFWTDSFFKASFCKYNPLHRKILELEKEAFENPRLQKLFTNSYMVKKQILDHYSVDAAKIQVIHNGVEWNEMQQDFSSWEEKKEEALALYQIPSEPFHFLFIGNGYARKGLDQLLLALSCMKKECFHLSVIGKDRNLEAYKRLAKKLGLAKQVLFLGAQKNTRSFYQMADCLVIPSFYDPFANVTVEALAMGLFVISSQYNGAHEILSSENGSIIENLLDPDAISQELLKAMSRPKTLQRSLSIRHTVQHLDFSHQLHTLVESCG